MLQRLVEKHVISPPRLVAVIAALAVLVYMAVFFMPRRAVIAALAQQRDQLKSETAVQRAALVRLQEAHQSAGPESVTEALQRALPDAGAVAPLLTELTQRLGAVGMSIEQIKRRPDKAEDGYVALAFAIEGRGTYLQVTGFLRSLERMTRLVDVVGLTLRAHPQRSEPASVIDASCELRTYYRVDQPAAGRPRLSSEAAGENR